MIAREDDSDFGAELDRSICTYDLVRLGRLATRTLMEPLDEEFG